MICECLFLDSVELFFTQNSLQLDFGGWLCRCFQHAFAQYIEPEKKEKGTKKKMHGTFVKRRWKQWAIDERRKRRKKNPNIFFWPAHVNHTHTLNIRLLRLLLLLCSFAFHQSAFNVLWNTLAAVAAAAAMPVLILFFILVQIFFLFPCRTSCGVAFAIFILCFSEQSKCTQSERARPPGLNHEQWRLLLFLLSQFFFLLCVLLLLFFCCSVMRPHSFRSHKSLRNNKSFTRFPRFSQTTLTQNNGPPLCVLLLPPLNANEEN